MINIRHPKEKEYDDIESLANDGYSNDFFESKNSFVSKIKGFPEGCYVAELDGIIGYIISFPYYLGESFPINTKYAIIENPNCWYIHDLCVMKSFRKKGIASLLAKKVLKNSWNIIALTAVQDSEKFWNTLGFLSFKDVDYCDKKSKYMILIKT